MVVRAAVGVFVVAMAVLEAVGEFLVAGVLVTVNVLAPLGVLVGSWVYR